MQEAAPEGEEIDVPGLQAAFAQALEELNDMSGAKVGDKTMMDALIPASEAVAAYAGADEAGLFAAAAQAAAAGAENSKNFVSKFGRAKSYGAQTIGTPDAGAMSMAQELRRPDHRDPGRRRHVHGLFLPGPGSGLLRIQLTLFE